MRPTWDQLSPIVGQSQSWLEDATDPCTEWYKNELQGKATEIKLAEHEKAKEVEKEEETRSPLPMEM